ERLWLNQNQIQDISPLAKLDKLERLWLNQNQIQDISPLAKLDKLQYLSLDQNQIQDISPLAKLDKLQYLSLSQNQIQDLSPLLPLYKKDIYLDISFNPLLHPPLEVVERGRSSIIAYLELLQSGEKPQFLREAKVVIIGEGGTGKSSLLQKMKDKNNGLPKETERTRGIEVAPLHFTDREGNDFQMNVWDFGGQGIYQATHQFFLSKRSLYLLLDDTRRSDSTLQDPTFNYWLQVSELYGGESPLLIVQNEKEDFSKQINFADMQQRFPFVKALYATNIKKTNKDWKRLQHDIQEFLCQLPHIGTWMRKEWVEIRKDLIEKAEKRDFIAWEEYEEVCQEKGIEDEKEMLLLSALLHDLGTILHFQDNSLLKQRLILKKEWATEAIYKVLDCEVIKQEKRGQFSETDLARIWSDKKWKNSIPQLLALMAEFEICYWLEDSKPKTYLAPLLLPAETPKYEWEKQENLVLRYKYRFMPQGILSRLIVRLHRFVKDTDKAWKTGVLLYHENTAVAEVRDMYGESEIRISISGKEKKEFMHIIRSELDALNATFPFQDFPDREKAVRKLIPCVCNTCQQAAYPHYYEYEDLQRRVEKKKETVECKISYDDVPVKNVLDAVLYSEKVSLAKEIRELVAKGETEKALNLLRKYEETSKRDETILLSARHSFFMRDKLNLDVVDKGERNKIAEALVAICRELEEE
ncbi:MAG: COR domain-containing protein, partial [Bacteroidia bacterium]